MRELRHFLLDEAGTLALRADGGARLSVLCGRIWLTQSGQLRDEWLSAGQTLDLPPGARVWISRETADGSPARVQWATEVAGGYGKTPNPVRRTPRRTALSTR